MDHKLFSRKVLKGWKRISLTLEEYLKRYCQSLER